MLYLLIAKSIIYLAIVTYSDSLVRWEILILAGLVELTREDYKRWNILARRVNILDRRYPLIIA
jgi:hypothetical protein